MSLSGIPTYFRHAEESADVDDDLVDSPLLFEDKILDTADIEVFHVVDRASDIYWRAISEFDLVLDVATVAAARRVGGAGLRVCARHRGS